MSLRINDPSAWGSRASAREVPTSAFRTVERDGPGNRSLQETLRAILTIAGGEEIPMDSRSD